MSTPNLKSINRTLRVAAAIGVGLALAGPAMADGFTATGIVNDIARASQKIQSNLIDVRVGLIDGMIKGYSDTQPEGFDAATSIASAMPGLEKMKTIVDYSTSSDAYLSGFDTGVMMVNFSQMNLPSIASTGNYLVDEINDYTGSRMHALQKINEAAGDGLLPVYGDLDLNKMNVEVIYDAAFFGGFRQSTPLPASHEEIAAQIFADFDEIGRSGADFGTVSASHHSTVSPEINARVIPTITGMKMQEVLPTAVLDPFAAPEPEKAAETDTPTL